LLTVFLMRTATCRSRNPVLDEISGVHVGSFGPKQLPTTSYGYRPPPDATAKGWVCTSIDCGVSEHEYVRRWPKACTMCGSNTDPLFELPWEHDAEGIQLQWILHKDPERGGGFYRDQWAVWQFKDAALRGDRTAMASARADARSYATQRMATASWWGPGNVYLHLVWVALQVHDLDGAADDLCRWLNASSANDVENNNTNRTNCRQVIDSVRRFLAEPGGAAHPRFAEIRRRCLELAEGAYPILNRDLQNTVAMMAHS
jgi:hypothetical protein